MESPVRYYPVRRTNVHAPIDFFFAYLKITIDSASAVNKFSLILIEKLSSEH